MFILLRHHVTKDIDKVCAERRNTRFDVRFGNLEMCYSIIQGYESAVSVRNITSEFRNSGLLSLDATVVCNNGICASSIYDIVVSVDKLNSQIRHYLVSFKRHGPPDCTVKCEFINTEVGIQLIRADVREKIQSVEAERDSDCI